MHPHREAAHKDRSRRVAEFTRAEDKVQDRRDLVAAVAKGIHEHEAHDHKGEPKTKLKLARGGAAIEGRDAGGRMDRAGGKKGKGKAPKVNVNVISGAGSQPRPVPVPVPVRAPAAGAPMPPVGAMPPRPMPPVSPPGGVPGMGAGPMVPGMRKRGGRTTGRKRA